MALNYAKAFKTKNGIIDYIEKYEGFNNLSQPEIDNYLNNLTYQVSTQTINDYKNDASSSGITVKHCDTLGYCIEEYEENGKVKARVVTFIEFSFFDLDDNYNYTSVIRFPSMKIKGEIRKYSPEEFWNDTY